MGLKFTNYKPAFVDVTDFRGEEYIHSKEDFYRRFPKDKYTKLNYVYTPIVVDGVPETYTLKDGDWILGFFYKDFNKVKTQGSMAFEGFMKGKMTDTRYPAFGFKTNVTNGYFKYPQLPEAVSNIFLNLDVSNKDQFLSMDIKQNF